MEVLGEDLFVKLQEKMDFIPHTQSYGWLKYTIAKRNKSVIFFSNSIENTLICCWGEIVMSIEEIRDSIKQYDTKIPLDIFYNMIDNSPDITLVRFNVMDHTYSIWTTSQEVFKISIQR